MKYILRITRAVSGGVPRLELNGVELPVDEFSINIQAGAAPVVKLTMIVDDVLYDAMEVESTVVDADVLQLSAPQLRLAPSDGEVSA